jgi:disease resistance protein RPM1
MHAYRYFIVIDDVWEVPSWKVIRTALEESNSGSKILITTRCSDVGELVHCTYKIQPLCADSSKILFHGRIFGSQDRCPASLSELSDKILKKCGGVPLAIITIASLLANKSDDITEWQEVCSSIGSGLSSSNDMYNGMRKILLLSYYDLPSQMKTCFLYLSMYPEDKNIRMSGLIWRWISEGFIRPQKTGDDLFELGKCYFNDLINRSLVQPTVIIMTDEIWGCRVHDMILDLICSLSREENFVTTSDDMEQAMP